MTRQKKKKKIKRNKFLTRITFINHDRPSWRDLLDPDEMFHIGWVVSCRLHVLHSHLCSVHFQFWISSALSSITIRIHKMFLGVYFVKKTKKNSRRHKTVMMSMFSISTCWLLSGKRMGPLMHQCGRSISQLHARSIVFIFLFSTPLADRTETPSFCMV